MLFLTSYYQNCKILQLRFIKEKSKVEDRQENFPRSLTQTHQQGSRGNLNTDRKTLGQPFNHKDMVQSCLHTCHYVTKPKTHQFPAIPMLSSERWKLGYWISGINLPSCTIINAYSIVACYYCILWNIYPWQLNMIVSIF